ncbi:MAG: alpha/beta hydrolase [Blautia sp.]|nr:alpha/beta hydrolase [Blautia sp.]
MKQDKHKDKKKAGCGRIAVLFPGIGYTCDKPLLYYGGKLAAGLGYEVVPVPYGHFPKGVKGDPEKMHRCMESALAQAEEMLEEIRWEDYADIVFLGKSIGTAVAVRYAAAHGLRAGCVLYTPLVETFSEGLCDAIAFHGTADPWADTTRIKALCEEAGIPLYMTENANHSLETGDLDIDIPTIRETMKRTREYLLPRAE